MARIQLTAEAVNTYSGITLEVDSADSQTDSTQTKEMTMEQQAMRKAKIVRLNGLDIQAMTDTINALKARPNLAQFQFRAKNQWIDGGENRSTIKEFFGAGAEDQSREEAFVFTNGEPPVLLGSNEGANPVEYLLHALAGCVTTTTVLHAAARGIKLRSLSTELVGDIDLQGLLGLDESVSPGYREIRIKMDIEADCSDEELDDLLGFAQAHSPVCNTVCRPVPVVIERVSKR